MSLKHARTWAPRMSAGRLLVVAVIAFLSISAVIDVVTSLGSVGRSSGPPKAQMGGQIAGQAMAVGRASRLTLSLFLASGSAMDPACVGANLSPEFRVVRVTFLGTSGTRWSDNESCGQVLETNSTIPIVITVVPLHPGDFTVHAVPKVHRRRVGTGPTGEVLVRP